MENNKYNWDLESLLRNKSINDLFNEWYKTELKQIALVNNFYKTKENFKHYLELSLETSKLGNRLINYISNHNAQELDNPKWIGWEQKITYIANELSIKTANWTNLVIEHENKIKSYLKDPKLKVWTRAFNLIFKRKKHILDKKSELLLTKISPATTGIFEVYSTLKDSDLKYADAIDKNNKPHQIKTPSDVIKLLKNPKDRQLRKSAWISFNSAFNSVKNTFTKTLYFNYLKANKLAQIRNFKDYIDSALDADEVNDKVLLSTYKNVATFKQTFVNYRKHKANLIKKIHHIKELEPWDLTLDLTTKTIKFTVEEAQQEVLKALSPMGDEYLKIVEKAFKENWISWLPKPHKTTGAYSIGGTYGLDKYYILMNFDNTSDSVSTVAHEMGHSINSYFINQEQDIYAEVDMFVAEIASIVNEMLLNFYWLNKYKNNKNMTLHILENMLSTFFSTTSRQVAFSKFEYEANKLINAGKPFTVEDVENIYLEARKEYEGVSTKALAKKDRYPYNLANAMILRVQHFYFNNFYVYKYAIGQVIALVVADKIYHGDKEMLSNYFKFLGVGHSIPPLEIIELLGIDLTKDQVYKDALKIVNNMVKQFQKIKK